MAIDLNAIDMTFAYHPFFIICVMVYLLIFGIFNIWNAFNTRNNPEKRDHPEYFKNEIIVGVAFFIVMGFYPFLFDKIVTNDYVKAQIYFHLWNSLTVHILMWVICIPIWRWNNKRKGYNLTYEQWKEKIRKSFKDNIRSDFKRKMMHLIPAGIIIGFYYLGVALDPTLRLYGWDGVSFTIFFQATVGVHFLWMMNIGDHLRLRHFDWLGGFAINWNEGAIKTSELDTITSANHMALALVPFVMSNLSILFAVALIMAISDAMASIVGKGIGKKRNPASNKTIEGYLAGMITTYAIVLIVHTFAPFEGATWFLVNGLALGAALGFLLVDRFATEISDNFLNPVVCGSIMWAVYSIFILL